MDLAFWRQVQIFRNLKEADLARVAEIAVEKKFPGRSVLFLENEPGEGFYIVQEGLVKVYKLAADGREKVLQFFAPGDFFGEMALVDEGNRSATAETLEPTTLLIVGKKDFLGLISRHPEISFNMIQILTQRLRRTNAQLEHFVFRTARGRVIHAVLDLIGQHGEPVADRQEARRVSIRLTHQELAGLAGTSRETATRVLIELQEKGIVTFEGRHLLVYDLDALTHEVS